METTVERSRALQNQSLDAMVEFEQLALRSRKAKICAACCSDHGDIPQGPTSYCHVIYYMCSECHEHYNGPWPA